MNLRHTFAVVDAIHSGELRGAEYDTLPTFNLQVRCLCAWAPVLGCLVRWRGLGWSGLGVAVPCRAMLCCAVLPLLMSICPLTLCTLCCLACEQVPRACSGVPSPLLLPSNTWDDKEAYDLNLRHLARLFVDNFKKFEVG